MATTWCLVKSEADKFRRALKDGSITPEKLSEMSSQERREFLSKYVGEENARNVNALFESKLLLKNQQAGMISWAKSVANITPKVRKDLISRIERLERVLDPKEGEQFLQDLASTRVGADITQEEAKKIADMSRDLVKAKSKASPEGKFPSEEDRLNYGIKKVEMADYVSELKTGVHKITALDVPGTLKSVLSSLDNSYFGRQGIKNLLNPRTSDIWVRDFVKSWGDIGKQLAGKDAMKAIRADVVSRPNAINGKYEAGDYGLDVSTEEAFPTSFPEKIPGLGRLFKASEAAYNGGALRMRADLADRVIARADKYGINTLNKDEARPLGRMVSSLTGRGSISSLTPEGQKQANALFFSVKFMKSNFDTLTAHWFDKSFTPYARKEAAKNWLGIITTIAGILTVAKTLDPDSVDLDPRSTNAGKIKIFGHWTDITGGMAGMVVLASRLVPTYHNGELGFWYKSGSGKYKNLGEGYGQDNALDVFEGFFEGKLSPVAGVARDVWKKKDYEGNPVTLTGVIKGATIPFPIQSFQKMMRDPNSSFVLGSMILEGLGFSTSSTPETNIKTKIVPEGQKISNNDFIDSVILYSRAFGTDPETAFNRIFTGQKIVRVSGNAVIVERMPLEESQDIKKKAGANNPSMKLDHTIPLELGGSNDKSNLKLVTTSEWSKYTSVENALGKALKAKKITRQEAQKLIVDFKQGKISKENVLNKIK
jgi:hypothetical protein